MSKFSRVLICGSRDFTACPHNPTCESLTCPSAIADHDAFMAAMTKWIAKHGKPNVVIEGCARGADSLAEHWAETHLVTVEHYPAQWDLHGKAAGPIRNQQMLDEGKPDAVIAFSRDLSTSRGTADMVRRARKAGLPVWIAISQPQQKLHL